MRATWRLLKETVLAFVADGAASRGAAIAYYTATSLAPVLIIVIAIGGVAFGQKAAQGEVAAQISGLMGKEAAEVLQSALKSASNSKTGSIAGLLGFITLLITASGVFGEMQSALNTMWKAHPQGGTMSRLVRARAASLGLVAALGFLLLTSLVVSAAISALGQELQSLLPFGKIAARALNTGVSLLLVGLLFAAIYKVLPDRHLTWRDVAIGAAMTAVLFTIGKFLIGLYLGSSSMASSYGAASGLIILLAWIYYSSQMLLLGAEFTKVYASNYGSLRQTEVAASVEEAAGEPVGSSSPPQPEKTGEAPVQVAHLRSRLEKARSG